MSTCVIPILFVIVDVSIKIFIFKTNNHVLRGDINLFDSADSVKALHMH